MATRRAPCHAAAGCLGGLVQRGGALDGWARQATPVAGKVNKNIPYGRGARHKTRPWLHRQCAPGWHGGSCWPAGSMKMIVMMEKNCNTDADIVRSYMRYLKLERNYSPNTLDAYRSDIQKLIDYLTNEKRKLTMTQEELRKEHSTLKDQNADLAKQNKELKSAADERNAVLAKVRKDKKLFLAEQEELQRASEEMQAAIKKLLQQKQKLKAQADAAKRKQGKPVAPTPVYYKGGRLAWPIQGKITSQFGTRVHPVFKTKITHTGLDISAPKGTPIKAADPGEVLYTGWMRGYGQVVIIDHGANLTTVYAHMSKIETSENAKVTRQTVIGRVGATGVATGNHLHFEVRVNGDAVNPMKYLK